METDNEDSLRNYSLQKLETDNEDSLWKLIMKIHYRN